MVFCWCGCGLTDFFVRTFGIYGTAIYGAEFIYRAYIVRKEIYHEPEEMSTNFYHNRASLCDILSNCQFNKYATIYLGICLCCLCVTLSHTLHGTTDHPYLNILSIIIAYIIGRFVDIQSNMTDAFFIRNSNGLDYGSGMAHNYFTGYLNFVLPCNGEGQSKDITDKIKDYEDTEHVKFPIKKLFILIPQSMHIPTLLIKRSKILVVAKRLEGLKKDRAGNPNRQYSNAVYQIKTNKWYVAMEGATPILSFYETLQSSAADPRMIRHKNEIVLSFIKTLKRLIHNSMECRHLCEIICYNDDDNHDIGVIIKQRIEELLDMNNCWG